MFSGRERVCKTPHWVETGRCILFLYGNGRLLVIADYQCKNELAVIWLGHGPFYLFRNKLLSRQSVTI